MFGYISYIDQDKILYLDQYNFPNETTKPLSRTYSIGTRLRNNNFLYGIDTIKLNLKTPKNYRTPSIQPYIEDGVSGSAGES